MAIPVMEKVEEAAGKALEKVNPAKPQKTPEDVEKRLKRGRERLAQVAPRRREAIEFANGNHYVSVDKSGLKLVEQSTVPRSQGGDKPDHRVRRSRDLIGPILKGKVSGATQRIPGYEVVPSTSDPEDYSASRLGKKILIAGYEGPWRLKKAFRKFVWDVLVTEEAFIGPTWDSQVGPYVEATAEDGSTYQVGMGELKAVVYNGLEVMWESGVEYEDSPWIAIEHAVPKDSLEADPDFLGGPLKADADENAIISGREKPKGSNLVVVTEFFERPCAKYPKGNRLWLANGHEIFARADYPLLDEKGRVVDAPCLHRVVYNIDGSSDRHRGLVQSMIESMRQYDYGANKAAEYLQLVLVPQIMAPEGAIKGVINDEPGAVVEIDPDAWAEGEIKWRDMPAMPSEFGNAQDRAQAELGFIAHDNAVPSQVESGKAIEGLAQKDAVAWQDFLEDLAEAHQAFGRDALCLVQQHYTEERLMQFRGRTGWETIADFKGADLRGQKDVRVNSATLEARSRAAVEQQIMALAGPTGLFPGHFPPEVVLRALSSGDIDSLNEAFEEDEARVNFIISQIRFGTFWDLPDRPVFPGEEVPRKDPLTGEVEWQQPPTEEVPPEEDPVTGEPIPETGEEGSAGVPVMETEVPGWMPRPFDNIPIHKLRIETFMKSDEWNHLPPQDQKATMDYYRALIDQETKNAARANELQTQRAEELGARNAAKPQGPKPMPSQPGPEGGGEGESAGGSAPAESPTTTQAPQ